MSEQIELRIHGMDCAEEVAALKAELAPMPGIEKLGFEVLNGKMTVTFSPAQVTPQQLILAVGRAGLKAEPWQDVRPGAESQERTLRTVLMSTSGALLMAGASVQAIRTGWQAVVGADETVAVPWVARLLYVAAIVAGSWFVAPKAWRSLARLRPDMNLLMMVAVLGAIVIQEYLEAATVAFLFALSLSLEAWSVGRARRAIAALMSLSPTQARIMLPDGSETMVDTSQVAVGSTVVVLPGEQFPLDGKLSKGETTVNQAPITGESVPVAKSPGSDVYSGTINQEGAVEFVTSKPAGDTTLARIIRMVGDAQSKRSPSEQWVERFARYYTPAVMAFAILIMLAPPLLFDGAWSRWFYEGLVLLVIACPCALVISTPVSIVAALTASARQGVLVKGGPAMEAPAHLRAIALDKTGTLTVGRPEVRDVIGMSGHSEEEVLAIAAAVETRSEHPLANAVLRAAAAKGIKPLPAVNFQAVQGKGATASVSHGVVWVGSHRLLEERGQETPEMHSRLLELEQEGASVIVIGKDDHVCGLIALADQIRPESREAIVELRRSGIERIVMLTGDNRGTGEVIGQKAGVDEVRAELLPDDKVIAVEKLVSDFQHVAMIGDGVNDAPALARATVGIAMGAAGSDAALETADIALMGDDLRAVPWLIDHSRRTLRVIRQNIFGSLAVKAVFMVLTLLGMASLWSAIAADTGASLVVIFNGLRLLNGVGPGQAVATEAQYM
ncbi:MAG: cation-translocating P-type ATPase [Pirellulales bacterium]|nr:cation-translocating P-type ATPase [Pirellulales bacterium]